MKPLATDRESVFSAAVELRRRLHAHPETAFEEVATAGAVAERMRARGFAVRTGLGRTGVSALYDTGVDGPTVLLRADLDALPVAEETGLPYAAGNGNMHACGHDGHVAALDAAADLLLLDPPRRGRVVFAFQPAEEGAGGAKAMIADGVLDPEPDVAFGVHLWTALPLGVVGVTPGPMMAAVDEFRIDISGPGGHAASPHEARDAIVAAAQVITALQTVVSRRLSPLQPAVVSVTSVHGGSAFNVLPGSVVLTGTCRAFDKEAYDRLPTLVEATAMAAAATLGCEAKVNYKRSNEALINDAGEASRCWGLAERLLGPGRVTRDCRTMGGEDFAEFLTRVPGAFAFVGAARPEEGLGPAHHSPTFDFDERAMATAARLHEAVARDVLAQGKVLPI